MLRYRFEHLCTRALTGQQRLVRNPKSFEEGIVTSCIVKNRCLVVKTTNGGIRCWDYRDCYEMY